MEKKSDIAVIGLGVMGENIAQNFERNGYRVTVFDRHPEKTAHFMEKLGNGKNFHAAFTPAQILENLDRPRKIFLMVSAGDPVDEVIDTLVPITDYGDIIIDGGNSYYKDSERRCSQLLEKGRVFIGCGVSGGAEGALRGPSLMPGGMKEGWPPLKEMFEKIAAKAPDGSPCCKWIGPGGSGHFVKMVHNGIEYGEIQLISETYFLLKKLFGYTNEKMADIFKAWNEGPLSGYLISITSEILKFKEGDGKFLIDKILDVASQKGTGGWSVQASIELESSISVIAESVYQRYISSCKDLRVDLSYTYPRENIILKHEKNHINELKKALYASKLICYTQGFALLQKASDHYQWNLKLAEIASIWRAGCIIRSVFLENIINAYEKDIHLKSLLDDLFFITELKEAETSWKRIAELSMQHEIAVPAHTSASNYFYSITTDNLPANLIQAQRDYFGSHMFERNDTSRGQFFHNDWKSNK